MTQSTHQHQDYQLTGLWKTKSLIAYGLIIVFLFASWLFPLTRQVWDIIDRKMFVMLNTWIQSNPFWQTFWALANHKNTDWFFDIVILFFVVNYIIRAPKHLKLRRFCEIFYTILITALTILLINRVLFRDVIVIYRESPSLITPMATLLNQVLPWMSIKTSARFSFPGDHATTCMMFILTMNLFLSRGKALLATLVGIFFMLPRLIVGAHWFTDVAIGSLSISLFSVAVAFYTPLFHLFVSRMENILYKMRRRKNHERKIQKTL